MDKKMTRLYRSERDKKIFGLCGGLAASFNIDATLLRLIVVVTGFFSAGTTILLYLLACLVIPKESEVSTVHSMNGHDYYQDTTNYIHASGSYQDSNSNSTNIDEMMKDLEKKAMQKEINDLKAKLAKFEKGDV